MATDTTDATTSESTAALGLHLKRPCIVVADLERSLSLYRDVLGFRLDYVGQASPESYLYTVFQLPSQAVLTFAALSTEREPRALALTEVKGVELPPVAAPYRVAIVVQIENIEAVIPQLQALNLEILKPSYFTADGRLAFTEQGFYDRDRHLIVLYQSRVLTSEP